MALSEKISFAFHQPAFWAELGNVNPPTVLARLGKLLCDAAEECCEVEDAVRRAVDRVRCRNVPLELSSGWKESDGRFIPVPFRCSECLHHVFSMICFHEKRTVLPTVCLYFLQALQNVDAWKPLVVQGSEALDFFKRLDDFPYEQCSRTKAKVLDVVFQPALFPGLACPCVWSSLADVVWLKGLELVYVDKLASCNQDLRNCVVLVDGRTEPLGRIAEHAISRNAKAMIFVAPTGTSLDDHISCNQCAFPPMLPVLVVGQGLGKKLISHLAQTKMSIRDIRYSNRVAKRSWTMAAIYETRSLTISLPTSLLENHDICNACSELAAFEKLYITCGPFVDMSFNEILDRMITFRVHYLIDFGHVRVNLLSGQPRIRSRGMSLKLMAVRDEPPESCSEDAPEDDSERLFLLEFPFLRKTGHDTFGLHHDFDDLAFLFDQPFQQYRMLEYMTVPSRWNLAFQTRRMDKQAVRNVRFL